MSAYRETEDRLGAEEREGEAVRMLGRWRARVLARLLTAFAMLAFGPGVLGYWLVQELQLRTNDGIAFVRISILGGAAAWVVTLLVGRLVALRYINARTRAVVARLAADYEIPVERLAEIARMLRGL